MEDFMNDPNAVNAVFANSIAEISNLGNEVLTEVSTCIRNSLLIKYNMSKQNIKLMFDTIDVKRQKVLNLISNHRVRSSEKSFIYKNALIPIDDKKFMISEADFLIKKTAFENTYIPVKNAFDFYDFNTLIASVPSPFALTLKSNINAFKGVDVFNITVLLSVLEQNFLAVMNKYTTCNKDPLLFNLENVTSIYNFLFQLSNKISQIASESKRWDNCLIDMFEFNQFLDDILDLTYEDKHHLVLKEHVYVFYESEINGVAVGKTHSTHPIEFECLSMFEQEDVVKHFIN